MLLQQTGTMPPYKTVAYIIMQFCHVCGMQVSFQVLYFNLQLYSRHKKLPDWKRARPRRGAARAGHGHVPRGSAPGPRRVRLQRPAKMAQLQVGRGSCGIG